LLVLPLYGYITGERTWRTIGGNLLILEEGPDEGSVNVLWPLFHHGWESDRTLTWLCPLFWRSRSPQGSVLIVPPLIHARSEEKRTLFFWPLFGYQRDGIYREYSTLYPLFWYGSDGQDCRSLTFGGPLFHHRRKADDEWSWNILYPLIRHAQAGPEAHSRFFPFYLDWRNRAEDTRYLHILWPLVRHKTQGDETSFRLLFPYVTFRGKGEEHDFRVFWKWIRSSHEHDLSTVRVNPFFRRDENARGDLYWSVLGGLVSRKRVANEAEWKILWFVPL
jgi:hypothetical protein